MRKAAIAIILCLMMTCASAPSLAADIEAHTPSGRASCAHENCYWTLPMDITDRDAVWAMLMSTTITLTGGQKEQYMLRDAPNGAPIGEVTCSSQSVHVLGEDENGWTKVETYSSSFHGSPIGAWNALVTGYVETSRLQTREPYARVGLVVDKLTQRLYIFKDGELFTEMRVSTGLANERQPYNETRSGEFFLVSKVGDFHSDNLVCELGMRFNDGDLIHQVPYIQYSSGKDYSFCEKSLGERASHGCVRVQRKRTPEGVNMTWLWDNCKIGTKLVIWEDWSGREKPAVSSDALVYISERSGASYHKIERCRSVKEKDWPMKPIPYSALDTADYQGLTPCVWCNPPER